MPISLSLFAGAGAQFFDNSGGMLSGGLIYTYAAGTTTPEATYTSNTGASALPNPIVLDASGRIPTGQIWLSYGVGYKFTVKTSTGTLIGTYDNIPSAALPPLVNDAVSIAYEQGTNTTAGAFIVGQTYLITSLGSTNFQLIGASANTVGIYFIATGVGAGTGTAQLTRTVQAKLRDSVSVKDFGAIGDGTTDDTAAFAAAIAASKQIYMPIGTYLVSSIVFNTSGLSGVTFTGASTTQTIIKGTVAATDLFSVYGTNNQINVFERFTLDMSLMSNVATSRGLYLSRTWGNSFRNVNVKNSGSNAISCYLATGTYTSIFDNCDFGSGSGVVKLQGISLSDAVTTITFIGCSFGSMISDNAVSITLLQPIVQGALDKFVLSNTVGFSILNGDIEGTGTYLVLGSSVGHLASSNNQLVGFTGTYSSGTFIGGYLMDQYGGTPFTLSPNAGTTHNGAIIEQMSTALITRKIVQNTNVTPQTVDINIKSGATNQMFSGITSTGDSYIVNRGSGKNVLQVVGTDKLGVSATNQLIIGTATTSTATTGANGATPAQVYGYLSILIGATTYKIPVYNN